jgi:hypothetical protein
MKYFLPFCTLLIATMMAVDSLADAPVISYTPVHCTQTAPVSLSAEITDSDGINVSPGQKPRLYYKKVSESNVLAVTNDHLSNGWKFVEASNAASPFIFHFDFSKLTSPTTKNDSIQYFVIAEDIHGEVNWNSAVFSAAPSGVSLTSAQFPATSVAHFFRTIKTYSGNLTIDPLGVANDTNFLSISKNHGLFDAINQGALSGNVLVTIRHSSVSENGLHALNEWEEYQGCVLKDTPTYRLRIRPHSTGIEVRGRSANAIIRLNGADRVTIDGRPLGVGSGRGLTIRNDSSASNTAVVHLISNGTNNGCEYDTIRFCHIVGGAPQNTTSRKTFGIFANKSLSNPLDNEGWGNNYNSFEKNFIRRVRYGIALLGHSDELNRGNSILFNTIGPDAHGIDAIGAIGIAIAHQDGCWVRGNEVKFVGGDLLNIADTADRVGIYLGTIQENLWNSQFEGDTSLAKFYNVKVDGNKIHHIINQAGLSSVAIAYLNEIDNVETNNQISNNMVFSILSNGNTAEGDHAAGIGIIGGNTDFIVFNSILLKGEFDPHGVAEMTNSPSAIRINSTLRSTPMISYLTVANNAVKIEDATTKLGLPVFGISLKEAANIWSGVGCDFNLYHTPDNQVGGIGNTATYDVYATLGEWRTAFDPNQEPNSKTGNPQFKSDIDLHITPTSSCINAGFEFEGMDLYYDFDGDFRPEKADATIGADQLGKFYIWVGRENSSTTSDLNWKNYESPPDLGGDSIYVIVATERHSWKLTDEFTAGSLTMLPGRVLHLDRHNLHVLGDVDLRGSSTIYSGEGSCEQNYDVEDEGALVLSGSRPQKLEMGSGSICNLHLTNDSVTFTSHIQIQNDLIAKRSTGKIFHSNKTIEVKGDAKIWGELVYDSCTTLTCALFKISGTRKQLIDLRYHLTTVGKVANLQVDKNATGDNSQAMLGASLMIENFLDLKKGKLISEGSNAQTGLRFKTIFVLREDSNAITRTNGSTNDAFIQGKLLRKIGRAASYLFPLGFIDADAKHQVPDAPYYTPVVVEVLDSSGRGHSIVATYYDQDPDTANVGLTGEPYGDHSSAIEDGPGNWVDVKGDFVWHVAYSGDSLPYNIQLAVPFVNANNQDELASTPHEFRIMKRSIWNSGDWGFQGNHAVAEPHPSLPDFNQYQSARRTGLNTFSGFGIGGNSGGGQPLPVKILSIAAKPIDNKWIQVDWQTAAEINNEGFEVQRSTDGKHFEDIGWVAGAGNSSETISYTFTDNKVQPGIRYYYRLLQRDYDKNFEYSPVVSAQLKESAVVKWMQLLPNPASAAGSVVVNTASETVATLTVSDIKGNVLLQLPAKVFAGINTIPLDLSGLPAGNYIVTFSHSHETVSKQLMVR